MRAMYNFVIQAHNATILVIHLISFPSNGFLLESFPAIYTFPTYFLKPSHYLYYVKVKSIPIVSSAVLASSCSIRKCDNVILTYT